MLRPIEWGMPVSTGQRSGTPVVRERYSWWAHGTLVLFRTLTAALVVVGLLVAVRGVLWDVYFALDAHHTSVAVPVQIRDLSRMRVLQATSPKAWTILPFRVHHGTQGQGLRLYLDGVSQWETWVRPGSGRFILLSVPSTAAEQAASYGGTAVVGLCIGWGALLVRRLLLSIGRGHPFERRNAARLASIAGLIVAATVAAGMLPYLAARMVLDRLGQGGPGGPLYAHLGISAAPLWLAVFLLALAAAFRRGTELVTETEGLV